ncbi:MAG: class I SAM-dependent methyltransferase [Bdellovibrionaceae bacterium]|nr:class I SAM-dependent methyltransferase [Pseudobdellovibrionaceae bacterium]NUM57575.1 class I SAM-dependent methyltransferase [Pseudobdellovibrionaceae bacterium]
MIKLPLAVLIAEAKENTPIERLPEPDLIMESESQVEAFHKGSSWGGVMDSIHIFNLCQLSSLVRPGDQVLDLGCGPADFLLKAAALFPKSFFTGVDLSSEMLKIAKDRANKLNIKNIRFIQGDMTENNSLPTHSFDVIMSTLAVHHLPNKELFLKFKSNVFSLLKADGAVMITDFSRVKSNKTISLLADDMKKRQAPTILVEDYIHSLKAAFSEEDFQEWIIQNSGHNIELVSTQFTNFVSMIRTPSRIPFFKRQSIFNLPLLKVTLASWCDYLSLKLLCTKKFKMQKSAESLPSNQSTLHKVF